MRPSKRSSFRESPRSRRVSRASRASNDRLWILGMVGVSLVIAVAAAFLILNGGSQPAASIEGVVTFAGLPRGHEEGALTYPQTPPAGGVHNPAWQNCGIYDQPIPNEQGVHSLEHGAAWITYQPDQPTEEVEQLRTLVRSRDFALLSPYPDLPAPVVASAWGVQLKADSTADPKLSTFLSRYMQGPQTPEPGAPCTGGVGTPVEG